MKNVFSLSVELEAVAKIEIRSNLMFSNPAFWDFLLGPLRARTLNKVLQKMNLTSEQKVTRAFREKLASLENPFPIRKGQVEGSTRNIRKPVIN